MLAEWEEGSYTIVKNFENIYEEMMITPFETRIL